MDITVLELHLPDAQFNAPFSSNSGGEATEAFDSSAERGNGAESGGGGRSAIAALVVMVGLAALAWYLRSGRSGSAEVETATPPRGDVA